MTCLLYSDSYSQYHPPPLQNTYRHAKLFRIISGLLPEILVRDLGALTEKLFYRINFGVW